jgi:hypothetical protein
VALILPGIWLAVALSVSVPALLLERIRPFAAMRRSFRLVRGRWWPTFAVLLVGYLLIGIIGAIVQGIVMVVPSVIADGNTLVGAVGAVVGGTLGSVLTTPYSAAVITLVYFDLRVRKEGLDLQLIAAGADVEHDPDAPLPAPLVADEYTPEERAQAPYWPPPPGWRPAPPAQPGPPAWRSPREEEAPAWRSPREEEAPAWRSPQEEEAPAWRSPQEEAPPWRRAPEEPSRSGWLPPRAPDAPGDDDEPEGDRSPDGGDTGGSPGP